MIKIENLTKAYINSDGEKVVFRNFNLELPSKGMCFFCGKSGSGKSTLLNIIGLLDDFDHGSILINGLDISSLDETKRNRFIRNNVGFIFQEYNLLDGLSVFDNIQLGLPKKINNKNNIDNILKKVGIFELKDQLVNELSGGQKQRVAIARALLKKPPIIICDEPTSSLDSDSTNVIMNLLREFSKFSLVIVATHDRKLINFETDFIVELDNYKVNKQLEYKNDVLINNQKNLFSFTYFLKLAFHFIKTRFLRLLLCIVISIITFSLLSTSISISSLSKNTIIYKSMISNNISYVSYHKELYGTSNDENIVVYSNLSNEDLEQIKSDLDLMEFDVVYPYYKSLLNNLKKDSFYENKYDLMFGKINGFIEVDDDFLERYNYTVYGRMPQNDDEVVVPKYFYDFYEKYDYERFGEEITINQYSDLIGLPIYVSDPNELIKGKDLKIVGVLDTKFNHKRYSEENYLNNSTILNELEHNMKYGLHNILYFNKGFFCRNIKPIVNRSIYTKNFSNFEVILNDGSKINESSTIRTINEYDDVKYLNNINSKNGIILPKSILGNVEYHAKTLIDIFAYEHYDEIKESFEFDFPSYTSWEHYSSYIVNNNNNIYHEGKEYDYFVNLAFNELLIKKGLNENVVLNINNYSIDYAILNKKIDCQVIGFSNSTDIILSESIYLDVSDCLGYLLNPYSYLVVPMNNNYDYIDGIINYSNIENNDKINLIGLNKPSIYNYSKYSIDNEVIFIVNETISLIELFSYIFKYISIFLLFMFVLFVIYYFSGMIIDRKKSIGVLRSMGYSKNNICGIFLIIAIVLAMIVAMLSCFTSMLLIHFINSHIKDIFNLIITILNFNVMIYFIILIASFIAIICGLIIPLKRLFSKTIIEDLKLQ